MMVMKIRLGRPEDGLYVVPLLCSAIGDIAYMLTGTKDPRLAAEVLLQFYKREGNRISYENTMVAELDGRPVGFALFYHGSQMEQLDQPLVQRLAALTNNLHIRFTKEAKMNEFYLDSLAVDPAYQGRGIAKALLAAFETVAAERGHDRIALIVESDNENARRIYEKIGYEKDGELELCGHIYEHRVKEVR
jgi:ribosomal protein S18 acetylase RimI-like enzyme